MLLTLSGLLVSASLPPLLTIEAVAQDKTGEKSVLSSPPKSILSQDIVKALSNFDENKRIKNPGASDSPEDTFSIKEAIEVALTSHPTYASLASNRRATKKELEQAKSLYLPSIDLRADGGVEYTDNPDGIGGDDNQETLGRYDTSLTLTQLLYDGESTYRENLRQKARLLSASNRQREGAELIGLSVIEFYIEILRQRELLNLAEQNVRTHIDIFEDIKANAELGKATQADVVQIEARLEDAQAARNNTERSLMVAQANFKREVGARAYGLIEPRPPENTLSANVEQEIKIALENNPTLSIFESDINVARQEFEASKASLYPEFDLQLNARTADNLGGIQGQDSNASALVVMNWNLYRGGEDTARIQEFKYRHSRAKEEYAEQARNIENEVRNTWADMLTARKRMRNFERQAKANDKLVAAYQDQFYANRRTLLDVLDVQNEFFVSSTSMIDEKYLAAFSLYRLLALKGELLNTLSVNIPDRLQ